jgi:hypothetical protein
MIRKIVWASQHLEIDTLTGKLHEHEDIPATIDEDGEIHEGEIQNVMSTPFGLWRIDDSLNPYKQFKLWMGHTNFTISQKIANVIKNAPGVEILNILTRYRFLIGVGELFDIRNVRIYIEKALQCNKTEILQIDNVELKQEVENLQKELAKHDNWAIFVFPNGKIDYVTSEKGKKHFNDRLLIYKSAVDHSAGILIENSNE